jgi:hypothetical protein
VRGAIITSCCLLWAVLASAESVMVTTVKPLESSRHVRISVVLKGQPVKDVKVYFCTTSAPQTCFSVLTGDNGVAVPHALGVGNYQVTAVTEDQLAADLYLHVSRESKAISFSLDLTEAFQAAQAALDAAEKLPIRERVQEFRGVLQDPTGAMIAGVNIEVIRKGSKDKADVVRLKSDASGRFSAQLADGFYIAFFSFPGFRTEVVPFEVSGQGEKEMLVKLQIGQVTESLSVSNQP